MHTPFRDIDLSGFYSAGPVLH